RPPGSTIFPLEVTCLQSLLDGLPRPWLEVGVGTGRFASALGVEFGVDPAARPLRIARRRGIRVVCARGEQLPFRDRSFGAVLLVVTLCFVQDPLAVLQESRRVLRPDGAVLTGMVFADSPWGQHYLQQAAAGHPFYSAARFLTREELRELLRRAGLVPVRSCSTLRQPPGEVVVPEGVWPEDHPDAGFSAWLAVSRNASGG
ncbi:MAG: class I SAM-dependent methyltransferase, partial [bacterium]